MNTWIARKDLMKHHCLMKNFYNNLNIKDIKDLDYRHAIRVFKEFKINNLGNYYDL